MASYRIAVAIAPGVEFAIVAESVDELLTEYAQVKGNTDWLTEQIMDMVPASERGEGVGAVALAVAGALNDTEVPEQEDPVDEPEKAVERVDPWSGKPVREPAPRRSAARAEPRRATPAKAASGGEDSGVKTLTDKFGGRWIVGLPEAQDILCEHGRPAALHKWTSKAGKPSTAYQCAEGAPGGDWRDKCEFFQFPD